MIESERRPGFAVLVIEKSVGVEFIVAQELVEHTVKLACSRAMHEVDHGPARAPVLGGQIVGLNLELLQRVRRWHEGGLIVAHDNLRGAIEHHFIRDIAAAVGRKAIDRDAAAGGRRFARGARLVDPWGERDELHDVAAIQRERFGSLAVDHLAQRGTGGFEERSLSGDLDRFRDGPDFEGHVDLDDLRHFERQPGSLVLFKAGCFDAQVIAAWRELHHHVFAGLIGDKWIGPILLDVE